MGKKNKSMMHKDNDKKYLMSDDEVKDRRQKTCFVGNLPLDCSVMHLKAEF